MFSKTNVKFPFKKRWVALAITGWITCMSFVIFMVVFVAKLAWGAM